MESENVKFDTLLYKLKKFKRLFCLSNTGKSIKPSSLGDGQSFALSSFYCHKKSKTNHIF